MSKEEIIQKIKELPTIMVDTGNNPNTLVNKYAVISLLLVVNQSDMVGNKVVNSKIPVEGDSQEKHPTGNNSSEKKRWIDFEGYHAHSTSDSLYLGHGNHEECDYCSLITDI